MYAVIIENDESQYQDETGILYHFPKAYAKFLEIGTQVLYYKSRIKDKAYSHLRLSDKQHYFATAKISNVQPDRNNPKLLFAVIDEYRPFDVAIPFKVDDEYLEEIPEKLKHNYWRNGVRPINQTIYEKILSHIDSCHIQEPSPNYDLAEKEPVFNDTSLTYQSKVEGKPQQVYVTKYERNLRYRKQAIAIHGDTCSACGFNFKAFYGDYADGFIHIHHVEPISEFESPKTINPSEDLIPLCANCHSVIHRKRDKTLSLEELKTMIKNNKNTGKK